MSFKAFCYVCGKIVSSYTAVNGGEWGIDPTVCFQDNTKCMTCGKIPRAGTYSGYKCFCAQPVLGHYSKSDEYFKFVHCKSHGHLRHKECIPTTECKHGVAPNSWLADRLGDVFPNGCKECWIASQIERINEDSKKLPKSEEAVFIYKKITRIMAEAETLARGGEMFCATHQRYYRKQNLKCNVCLGKESVK